MTFASPSSTNNIAMAITVPMYDNEHDTVVCMKMNVVGWLDDCMMELCMLRLYIIYYDLLEVTLT